jgi:predicted TIM-barrel enzyme
MCPALAEEWSAAAVAVNPDQILLVLGSPLAMPEEPDYVLKNTNNFHAFYGGFSMKHLPTEIALKQQSRRFKQLVVKRRELNNPKT